MTRKSKKMLAVEERYGESLDVTLTGLLATGKTMREIAHELDVSLGTINYWLLREGLRVERVVLRADEEAIVRQRNGTA